VLLRFNSAATGRITHLRTDAQIRNDNMRRVWRFRLRRYDFDDRQWVRTTVGLIRFRGHLLEGGYDVDHGGSKAETDSAQVHG